jgi:SAM-dependent methyltransferase
MNRPWFEHKLPGVLAGLPELDGVLGRPGARVADVGCGGGWSTIAIARAYPDAAVEGWDVDRPSIDLARGNVAGTSLEDRVTFHATGAAQLDEASYDAIFAFECIHDMAAPVETLRDMRRALAPGGVVVIMDEAVGERFGPDGDDIGRAEPWVGSDTERLMYGFSLLICLPDGLSTQPSVGTGTVMRPDTLRGYAREAGFSDMRVLPTGEFGFWRFYQLLP